MNTRDLVAQSFGERFGGKPQWIVRAPGRVNLIGDHTDYNQGFVLPMAIDRAVWIALRARSDGRVVLHSLDFKKTLDSGLTDLHKEDGGWKEYARGVAWVLGEQGLPLAGWEGVAAGDVPVGSGLSSSAAFELAVARAFAAAAGWPWQATRMAQLMQKVENEWVGVASGIMDPLISAVAEEGKAALIDCRSLNVRQVAIPDEAAVVIMNSMKPRGLVDSAYNERRQQCEQAAAFFGVAALRGVSMEDLGRAEGKLDPVAFRRARHVLTENQRVLDLAQCLQGGDLAKAGGLMNQSHASLRDDFDVSCRELDLIVEIATQQPACWGARMTGAGFGGCAVALVRKGKADEFGGAVRTQYRQMAGVEPELIVTNASAGAQADRIP